MHGVLVDTSAWIETLQSNGDAKIRASVKATVMAGEAVLCDLVILELWNGARGEAETGILREIERNLDIAPTTPKVWRFAQQFSVNCRSRGWTVPATDLLIAACAEAHGLDLLHCDKHFTAISEAAGR